jgi:hypothetical protein
MTYATFLENFIDCPCSYFGLWLGSLFGIPVGAFLYMGVEKLWKNSSKD